MSNRVMTSPLEAKQSECLRWCVLPVVMAVVFGGVGVALEIVTAVLNIWFEPIGGFVLAAAWVSSAYVIAPRFKQCASGVAFVVGAVLAWVLVGHAWWPEGYDNAYQATAIPYVTTLIGGAITFVLIVVLEWRLRRQKGA